MRKNSRKYGKIFVFLMIALFACGCADPKGAQPQPVTLYANPNYAVQIQDGSLRYLYRSDDYGIGENGYPAYEGCIAAGIVEGERFEEAPEIISDSGIFVRDENAMPKGWQDALSYEAAPDILSQVEQWEDIVQLIGDMREGYAALLSDGTVVSVGIVNSVWDQEAVVEDWVDIVRIVSGHGVIYGLKQDGSVCVHAKDWGDRLDRMNLEKELAGWTDIVQIAGGRDLFALKKDGTVLTTAQGFYAYRQWKKITAIAASGSALVGIREDGTVAAECVGRNGFWEEEFLDWDEVEQIAVCDAYCIAIRRDGTVRKTGDGK